MAFGHVEGEFNMYPNMELVSMHVPCETTRKLTVSKGPAAGLTYVNRI